MAIKNSLAGVAVTDLDAAARWYEVVIGRPGTRPMPEVIEWSFDGGGGLQVFCDPDRAGTSSVTLVVDDRDAQVAALEKKKVMVAEKSESSEVDTAFVFDPDGNRIVLAQPKGTAVIR